MARWLHAEFVYSNFFIKENINNIHKKPVKEKAVVNEEDYYFSSGRNHAGLENDQEVVELFME